MNSRNSRSSTEDAKGIEGLSIDEPFDGDSTGVRPRVVKRLPLVHDALCEEVSQVEPELPSDDFVLPSWEELTGLRARVNLGESYADRDVSSGRQQAIDLVEAEQRRRSTAPQAQERAGNSAVASGKSRGGGYTMLEPVTSLPWVDRFKQDTNARLEAPDVQMGDIEGLEERFAPSARPPLSLPPPPPVSRVPFELPAPPSSRPISRPHVASSFPANRPLPRFALGPRMDGLLGADRRPQAVVPPSLAPVASNDVRPRERMNPWLAGLLGAVLSAAAGFAFFWSPQNESKSVASSAASAIEDESTGSETNVRPFAQSAAQQLANGAAAKARACGMGKVPTDVGVTFAPDGTVMSVDARGESRLSEDTAYCMDETFSDLRIPPFDGEAREVHLTLR